MTALHYISRSLKIHAKFHFTSCKHHLKLGDIRMNKHTQTHTHTLKKKKTLGHSACIYQYIP